MNTRIMAVAFVVAVFLFLSPSWVSASDHCAADLNGDGVVGPADLAMLLGSWGPCEVCGDGVVEGPEECDPPDGVNCDENCQIILGDCCFPHDTPGCEDPTCASEVCEIDPICCNETYYWDTTCAVGAANLCPECFGLDCCFEHSSIFGIGCTDEICNAIVCDIRPTCCSGLWDSFCVALADLFCEQCIP